MFRTQAAFLAQRGLQEGRRWFFQPLWTANNSFMDQLKNYAQELPFPCARKRARGVQAKLTKIEQESICSDIFPNQRTARSQFKFPTHSECPAFTERLFRQLSLCWNRQESSSPSTNQNVKLNFRKSKLSSKWFKGQILNDQESSGLSKPTSADRQSRSTLFHLQLWARSQAFHQVVHG